MNIKDYLHLYLGCECLDTDGATYKLKPSHFPANWQNTNLNHKPILRPLSDMTEQNCVDVARLAYGEEGTGMAYDKVFGLGEVGEDDNRKVIQLSEGNYVVIHLNKFLIENRDGLNDSEAYCHYDVNNMPAIIKYLLSKQFDLFDLIQGGLAIDATTLKQPA